MTALAGETSLDEVKGIAFRANGKVVATPPAEVIADLDAYRIGWELIEHANYTYWGDKRAVVIQFSRGCPHPCNYVLRRNPRAPRKSESSAAE